MNFIVNYFFSKLSGITSGAENNNVLDNETILYSSGTKNNFHLYKNIKNYTTENEIREMFKNAWNENPDLSIRILLHLRDYKNGRGEKRISHIILYYIRKNIPEIYKNVLQSFIEVGYWKDVLYICDILKENNENMDIEINLFKQQLWLDYSLNEAGITQSDRNEVTLCAKWAPSENSKYDYVYKKMIDSMKITPRQYRKMLSSLRTLVSEKHVILENNLSQMKYDINFENVPFKARTLYKNSLKRITNSKGEKKINRNELIVNYKNSLGRRESFNKLNDIINIKTVDENIYLKWKYIVNNYKNNFNDCVCVVDVSDSMKRKVKYSTLPIDVSVSLAMLINDSNVNNKLFSFSDDPIEIKLQNNYIISKIDEIKKIVWNNSLNYEKLSNLIQYNNIKKMFILTDMDCTPEEIYILKNIKIDKIVYWNLRSYKNEINVETDGNLTKITGFTNYLMDAVLNTDNITDITLFNEIIGNYSIKYGVPNIKI